MHVSPTGQSINRLGLNLLSGLCQEEIPDGGVAISPASISIALSMLAGGVSDDEKSKALYQALGADKPEQLNALFLKLQDCTDTVSLANAMFTDNSFQVNPAYVDHLGGFSADVNSNFARLVDATDDINNWVSEQTKGMIRGIVSEGILADAHIVLLNALAFKGIWEDRFDKQATRERYPFHITESKTISVDMMFRRREKILAHESSFYRAVCLPYEAAHPSGSTSFVAYLPHPDKSLHEVLSSIPPSQKPSDFHSEKFDSFGFPRMELSFSTDLYSLLQQHEFPMPVNFPSMGSGPNQVQNIIHKTAISLDEEGTRAAAVTAVVMTRSLQPTNNLIFDRPFAFSIIVNDTGVILFTGVFAPHNEN